MNIVALDAADWKSVDDFYSALLSALKAPAWHSRGINAIIDSIVGGGMNGVEPPLIIAITGTKNVDSDVLEHLKAAQFYLAKARKETCESFDRDVDATIEILS